MAVGYVGASAGEAERMALRCGGRVLSRCRGTARGREGSSRSGAVTSSRPLSRAGVPPRGARLPRATRAGFVVPRAVWEGVEGRTARDIAQQVGLAGVGS